MFVRVPVKIATNQGPCALDTIAGMASSALISLPVFEGLSAAQIQKLEKRLEQVSLTAGDFVFEQGSPAINLYILLEGEVAVVFKPYDGPAMVIARVQPGEVFGWSAMLERKVYTSAAQVLRNGRAFAIKPVVLQRLMDRDPHLGNLVMERLVGSIADRLRNSNTSVLALLSQSSTVRSTANERTVY